MSRTERAEATLRARRDDSSQASVSSGCVLHSGERHVLFPRGSDPMGEKEVRGAVRVEEDRPQFLIRLFLTAVTGFNLVLASAQFFQANWGWGITLLVVGVVVPGMIPFLRLIQGYKEGRIPLSWREALAFGIGAVDAVAIINRWRDGLEVTSWVSVFLISSLLAFLLLAES
jgi:hypothetical protein